jgi:hypothetical protein
VLAVRAWFHKVSNFKLNKMQTGYTGQGAIDTYNNTWGHFAPKKHLKYTAKVRITFTGHSAYGCQAIILDYTELEGPYFHNALFEAVSEKVKSQTSSYHNRKKTKFANGIWDIPFVFINYKIKFDFKNAVKVAGSLA